MTWNKVLLYCLDSFKKHQARVFLFMKNAAVFLPSSSERRKQCTWGHLAAMRSLSLSMGIYSSLSFFICFILHAAWLVLPTCRLQCFWALSLAGVRREPAAACTRMHCLNKHPCEGLQARMAAECKPQIFCCINTGCFEKMDLISKHGDFKLGPYFQNTLCCSRDDCPEQNCGQPPGPW